MEVLAVDLDDILHLLLVGRGDSAQRSLACLNDSQTPSACEHTLDVCHDLSRHVSQEQAYFELVGCQKLGNTPDFNAAFPEQQLLGLDEGLPKADLLLHGEVAVVRLEQLVVRVILKPNAGLLTTLQVILSELRGLDALREQVDLQLSVLLLQSTDVLSQFLQLTTATVSRNCRLLLWPAQPRILVTGPLKNRNL